MSLVNVLQAQSSQATVDCVLLLREQMDITNKRIADLENERDVAMSSLVIYALSRHDKLQALATACSGKYSLAPDNIALLFSTVLVDGGINVRDEVQQYKEQMADFYKTSTASSFDSFEQPYKKMDVVKAVAAGIIKGCSKTAVAIGLQKGTVHIMKNSGFSAYLKDLSQSKQLSKTLGFALARIVASWAVDSTINLLRKDAPLRNEEEVEA